MQINLRNPWVAFIALAIVLALTTSVGACLSYKRQLKRTSDMLDTSLAKVIELQQAVATKPKELVKIVKERVPVDVVRLIEKKVIVPATTTTITSDPVVVTLPCDVTGTPLPTASVNIAGTTTLLHDTTWRLYNVGKFDVNVGDVVATFDTAIPQGQPGHLTLATQYDETLTKMLRDHDGERRFKVGVRPIREWRLGWSAGVGVMTTGSDTTLGIGALYGVQF